MKKNILLLILFLTFNIACAFSTESIRQSNKKKLSFSTDLLKESKVLSQHAKCYQISNDNIVSTPEFVEGIIYSISTKGVVSAYSVQEKRILWDTDTMQGMINKKCPCGEVMYNNNILYVTNCSRDLIMLDAKSGDEILRKRYPDIINKKPVIAKDKLLLVQTISNQLIACNIETLNFAWCHEGRIGSVSIKNYNDVQPFIYNNMAIASYSSGEIVSIDIQSGKDLWCYNLNNITDTSLSKFNLSIVSTMPVFDKEYAYFCTSTGKIIKIDLDNGAPVWVKNIEDDSHYIQSISLIDNYLLVTHNDFRVHQVSVLSAHNGQIIWTGELMIKKDSDQLLSFLNYNVVFYAPFVLHQDDGNFVISVVGSHGKIYNFVSDSDGFVSFKPIIKNIKNTSIIDRYIINSLLLYKNHIYLINGCNIIY